MFSSSLSPAGPAVNADGSLKKYPTPVPTTPATFAAAEDNVDALRLIEEESLTLPDESGNTALIWAADRGSLSATQFLIKLVDINHQGFIGNTALARAARGGHVDCVNALLAAPTINPNIHNNKFQYPLHYAAFKKHRDCVKAMIASGKCDYSVKDRKGRIPAEDTSDSVIRGMLSAATADSSFTDEAPSSS
jgi:ankyrin repeat protein